MDTIFFDSKQYIDFHKHNYCNKQQTDRTEIVSSPKIERGLFTIEKHPWYHKHIPTQKELSDLQETLKLTNCMGIGEVGLDKLKGTDINTQKKILVAILSANTNNYPIIIHCVKAFEEIIALKKQFGQNQNWAIHGYNKNKTLAKQLIQQGFFLSFNTLQLKDPVSLLKSIPLEKLFLETDNSSISIQDNYIRTAEILGIELNVLKAQIAQNAKVFFEHE